VWPVTGPDPFGSLDVAGAPYELIAVGGTVDATTLRSAYRAGCFPWPSDDPLLHRQAARLAKRGEVMWLPGRDDLVPWHSPDPRAVLLADSVVVRRSLRARLRSCGWEATVDTAFDAVVEACADRGEGTWITERMREGYAELHRQGGAHSVEVWEGDRLVGGLYGVQVGSVFCGESMFHRATDGSKVALVELCDRVLEGGFRLIDTQQETAHLAGLGQVLVPRSDYLRALRVLRDRPAQLPRGRRPVARLATRPLAVG
jgi:leucyl/phenylalanyl-tRNA--protein transferase